MAMQISIIGNLAHVTLLGSLILFMNDLQQTHHGSLPCNIQMVAQQVWQVLFSGWKISDYPIKY